MQLQWQVWCLGTSVTADIINNQMKTEHTSWQQPHMLFKHSNNTGPLDKCNTSSQQVCLYPSDSKGQLTCCQVRSSVRIYTNVVVHLHSSLGTFHPACLCILLPLQVPLLQVPWGPRLHWVRCCQLNASIQLETYIFQPQEKKTKQQYMQVTQCLKINTSLSATGSMAGSIQLSLTSTFASKQVKNPQHYKNLTSTEQHLVLY